MVYCSSDAWAGDSGPDENVVGWQFRGQRIIDAALSTLMMQQGLGSLPNTRLLFAGCSAGSRGAMFNLDRITASAPAGMQVFGLFDSPLWVDEVPLVTPQCEAGQAQACTLPLQNETQAVYALVNATAVLGAGCIAAYPEPAEQWKCLYGQVSGPR